MSEKRLYFPSPDADDRMVVEEMVRDPQSGHWYECRELVKKLVQLHAKNIHRDYWEDIVQDAMIRISKSLQTFEYQCKLRTWLFGLVRNCIIDAHRKLTHEVQLIAPQSDPHDDVEHETDAFTTNTHATAEDECIMHTELEEAMAALREYVSTHSNSKRNRQILEMVLLEGNSLKNAAKAVGCSAAVASYIVRSAQRYVREKLGRSW